MVVKYYALYYRDPKTRVMKKVAPTSKVRILLDNGVPWSIRGSEGLKQIAIDLQNNRGD